MRLLLDTQAFLWFLLMMNGSAAAPELPSNKPKSST
jgi:hypothetical protein